MSLRRQVLLGGTALAMRQGIGMLLSLANLFFVIRIIGPDAYGTFATTGAISTFAVQVLSLGIGVYLTRHPQLTRDHWDQAFSYLAGMGILALVLAPGLTLLAQNMAKLPSEAFLPMVAVFALISGQLLTPVPLARLERDLQYGAVARVELLGQITALALAVPLALSGKGVWAPVVGIWGQQAVLLGGYWYRAGYRPRWVWRWPFLRDMLSYGLGYSASMWAWQVRLPFVLTLVGRYVGPEGAGVVAATLRIVEALSFFKGISWRISVPVLGRLQADRRSLLGAVGEGALIQTLVVGFIFLVFSLVSPLVFPLFFGVMGSLMLQLFPYVALGYLFNATFSLQSLALYVLRYNFDVFSFHLVHVGLLGFALVWALPSYGLIGYGLAEVFALKSYGIIYIFLVRRVGFFSFSQPLSWAIVLGLALFTPSWGFWALVPLGAWLVMPWSKSAWALVRRYGVTWR